MKERVNDTMPAGRGGPEARDDFVQRVRNAVAWVNRNKHEELLDLCTNQKKRARDLRNLDGYRTKW